MTAFGMTENDDVRNWLKKTWRQRNRILNVPGFDQTKSAKEDRTLDPVGGLSSLIYGINLLCPFAYTKIQTK